MKMKNKKEKRKNVTNLIKQKYLQTLEINTLTHYKYITNMNKIYQCIAQIPKYNDVCIRIRLRLDLYYGRN